MTYNFDTFSIIHEGKNSILIEYKNDYILYEKLTNSIHSSSKNELISLTKEIEEVNYRPVFESESLKTSKKNLESIILNVTDSCNLRCSYCIHSGDYKGERVHRPNSMKKDVAFKAVNTFVDEKASNNILIGFYGGEPLNNIGLIKEVVQYAKSKFPSNNFIFSLTTNFVDANKHLEFLVNEGFYLNISLDGTKEIHDKYRVTSSGEETYDKIMNNLSLAESISSNYVKNHVALNATCVNQKDFLEIVNHFITLDNEFTNLRAGVVESKGLKKDVRDMNLFNELSYLSDVYVSYLNNNNVPPKVLTNLFYDLVQFSSKRDISILSDSIMLSGACYPGNHKLFINTNGDLQACEKFGDRLKIGDVNSGLNKDSVDSVLNNFTNIRNDLCSSDCWAQRICSPCMYHAKDESGISSAGLSQYCDSLKQNALLGLSIYTRLMSVKSDLFEKQFLNTSEV